MTADRNDLQKHLLAKVKRAADDHRQTTRDLVDAIIDGHALGMTAAEIADEVAAGMAAGRATP